MIRLFLIILCPTQYLLVLHYLLKLLNRPILIPRRKDYTIEGCWNLSLPSRPVKTPSTCLCLYHPPLLNFTRRMTLFLKLLELTLHTKKKKGEGKGRGGGRRRRSKNCSRNLFTWVTGLTPPSRLSWGQSSSKVDRGDKRLFLTKLRTFLFQPTTLEIVSRIDLLSDVHLDSTIDDLSPFIFINNFLFRGSL